MRRKSLLTLVIILMCTVIIAGSIGINNVSGDPDVTISTNLEVYPRKAVGLKFYVTILVDDAPHICPEPITNESKTRSYGLVLRWNPDVLNVTRVLEGWFFKQFGYYDAEIEEYWGLYARTFLYGDLGEANLTGELTIGNALFPPYPQEEPLPDYYYWGTYPPADWPSHLGNNYDLPWDAEADTGRLQTLARVQFCVKSDGAAWSEIDIEASFLQWNKTIYAEPHVEAWYGEKVTPEFPLGIGILMIVAPIMILPIIYISRRKGWKKWNHEN